MVEIVVQPFGQDGEQIRVKALIDSGADGTLLPLAVQRQMNARRTAQVALRTITGTRSIVDIYEVTLQLGPHHFRKVRVAADRHNAMAILGRDILNQMIVTLNGLAATTEIHE